VVEQTLSNWTKAHRAGTLQAVVGKSAVTLLRVDLVDLVGIEPTTSSMPWNSQSGDLLTAKGLRVG
jgi:hypothetical protein